MIKLTKGIEPEVLQENAANWTKTLRETIAAGGEPTDSEKNRYRHPDIKKALLQETHGKCAYCESKFAHITYGDVEHITPKSKHPEKRFQWSNLTVACDVCNTNKGDEEFIIDPYQDEPNDHLQFLGPMVLPRRDSDAGLVATRVLKLNRIQLLERRGERLESLATALRDIGRAKDEKTRMILGKALRRDATEAHAEYAAAARALFAALELAAVSSSHADSATV